MSKEWTQEDLSEIFKETPPSAMFPANGPGLFREIDLDCFDEDLPTNLSHKNLQPWADSPVRLQVIFGSKAISLGELASLKPQSVLVLDQTLDSEVTLTVNDKPFALGEIVAVDDHYGFRLTHFL